MTHIEQVIRALDRAGLGIHVYMDNQWVFAFDITCHVETSDRQHHTENIGHAIFAPPLVEEVETLQFVEGRILNKKFMAEQASAEEALFNFQRYLFGEVSA